MADPLHVVKLFVDLDGRFEGKLASKVRHEEAASLETRESTEEGRRGHQVPLSDLLRCRKCNVAKVDDVL